MLLRSLLLFFATTIMTAVPASSDGADGPAALDVHALDGVWILQHHEWDGRDRPWSRGDILALDSKRRQLRWHVRDENGKKFATDVYHFEIDFDAQPAEIDLKIGGRQLPGIFKYADDTITICFGRERPTEFSTQPTRQGYTASIDGPRLIALKRRQDI